MKISRKWLEQFVDLAEITDHDIASRLTMLGIEIESFENLSEKYKGFVVGSVLEVEKHPNADRLSLCKVDIGNGIKSIVCGAPNVAAGQKVAVGLVGALVPHSQHDPDGKPFELTRVKIRGVESEGMICSANELDLGDDKNGIVVFENDAMVGKPLAEYLGLDDAIFEVSLTPNRADCLSHLGIARELGSAFSKKLKFKRVNNHESDEAINGIVKIDVDASDLCPRYSARAIRDIKVGSSPQWLRSALEKIGMRSVNNVVDATNFVMIELGQPLHAFDLSLIKKKKIIVRRPTTEETKFTTLDGKERAIDPNMLMICDAEKIVAIAGVMGGMNSEINSETKDVLIESANFLPFSIRKTSKTLGLSTEASYRFERGVDPNLTLLALDRVAEIIAETAGGEVAKGIIDVAAIKFAPRKIELHIDNVNKVLGTRLASGEIKRYLDSIGIQCEKKNETVLNCWVPSFRGDIEREIDLIEEVARVYGYEKIDDSLQTKIVFDARFRENGHAADITDFLVGAGFNEIVTNSLQPFPADETVSHDAKFVMIANPISEDMAAMRTSMLPGMLHVIKTNLSFGTKNMKLFEIGKIYSVSEENQIPRSGTNFLEQNVISISLIGSADPHSYDRKAFGFDIFDMKSEIDRLFAHLNLDYWDFISYDNNKDYEQSLKVFVNGVEVGMAGRVSRETVVKFDIGQNVYFAQLNLAGVQLANKKEVKRYQPIPRFPFASIDLAFIVNFETSVGELTKALKNAAGNIVRDISVFDIYSGEGIPEGKKSVAFNIALGSEERTLNDRDIAQFISRAEDSLSKQFSAALRKQKD
jgi:phenylalanyl-tRNA synthetase beta chain